jgi:hypothetical protein
MSNNNAKLQDKGWQKMEDILNVEMPVREKRRRFFFWPISAAVFVAVWLGLWFKAINTDENKAVKEDTKYAAISLPQENSKSAQNSDKINGQETAIPITKEVAMKQNIIIENALPLATKGEAVKQNKMEVTALPIEGEAVKQNKMEVTALPLAGEAMKQNKMEVTALPLANEGEAAEVKKEMYSALPLNPVGGAAEVENASYKTIALALMVHNKLSPISSLMTQNFEKINLSLQEIQPTIVNLTNKNKWDVYVNTGVNATSFNSIKSYLIGASMQYRLSKYFSLSTGFNYNIDHNSYLYDLKYENQQESMNGISNQPNLGSGNSSYAITTSRPQSMIPLNVGVHFSNKLRLDAGLIYTDNSSELLVLTNKNYQSADINFLALGDAAKSFNLNNGVYNNNNYYLLTPQKAASISKLIGIMYCPYEKIALSFQVYNDAKWARFIANNNEINSTYYLATIGYKLF